VLGDARNDADLGEALGGGLTEREVRYLVEREWARSPEDVLWRRTKCGLHMGAAERDTAPAKISALL
jgi:glycerol-3-phosphate dehydrogenase